MALCEAALGCTKKYEIAKLLLSRGAEMTERSRQFVSAFSETFHRHTAGKKPSKFLQNQEAAVEKLCVLFDAKICPAASFHDGVSPILLTDTGGFKDNFSELWNFLVPPGGRAQVAQGEVIRIAGKVEHELLDNGGLNWDEDYRKMLLTFHEYLRLGNPSGYSDEAVSEIINALMDGDVNDGMILRLCYCARHWVEANPVVIPLIDADYTR